MLYGKTQHVYLFSKQWRHNRLTIENQDWPRDTNFEFFSAKIWILRLSNRWRWFIFHAILFSIYQELTGNKEFFYLPTFFLKEKDCLKQSFFIRDWKINL